jgi:hypothetical protein
MDQATQTTILKDHLAKDHRLYEAQHDMKVQEGDIIYAPSYSLQHLEELHRWHHEEESLDHMH